VTYRKVGVSLGGLYGLYFSNHNPDRVKGVVLLDDVSASMRQWFADYIKILQKVSILFNVFGKMGWMRILNYLDTNPIFRFGDLPEDVKYDAFALRSYGSFWDGMQLEANLGVFEEMANDKTLVNQVPIRMLDAEMDSPFVKGIVEKLKEAHELDMKMFKDVKRIVVKGATHEDIQFRKVEIVDAIEEIINSYK
jgi:pimeloyl-ACP methyl ester carboxylesterase